MAWHAHAPVFCIATSKWQAVHRVSQRWPRRRKDKESLINSATHLHTSARSSRRRQILDVAPLRLWFVSSIDTAHLCKSGRPHFISASLKLAAFARLGKQDFSKTFHTTFLFRDKVTEKLYNVYKRWTISTKGKDGIAMRKEHDFLGEQIGRAHV